MVPSDVAHDKEKIVLELLAKRGWKLTLDWLSSTAFISVHKHCVVALSRFNS